MAEQRNVQKGKKKASVSDQGVVEETPVHLPERLRDLKPNQRACLGYIRRMGDCSREELERYFGWKLETITRITKPFIDDGVLATHSARRDGDTRRRTYLYPEPSLLHAIGVELSFSHLRVGIVNLGGTVVASSETIDITNMSPQDTIQRVGSMISALRKSNRRIELSGVGVSFAGSLSGWNNASRHFPGKQTWENVALHKELQRLSKLPIVIHLDNVTGAMAELRYGKATRCNDFLFVHMHDGIGLSMVINGIVTEGSRSLGGEFGHTCVQPYGPWCYCGGTGCLEAIASSWAILQQVRSRLVSGVYSRHMGAVDPAEITLHDVCRSAIAGDLFAVDVLNTAGDWLGISISNVADLVDPERIILGGMLASDESYGPIIARMRTAYENTVHFYRPSRVALEPSELGVDAYIIGAAATVFERAIPAYPPQFLARSERNAVPPGYHAP